LFVEEEEEKKKRRKKEEKMSSVVRALQQKSAAGDLSLKSPLVNKDPLEKHYEVGNPVGEGAFSVVRVGCHKGLGVQVAIKVIAKVNPSLSLSSSILSFISSTVITIICMLTS